MNIFKQPLFDMSPSNLQELTNRCSVESFFRLLSLHDWFFEYTEDPVVRQKGQEERKLLRLIANKDDTCKQMLQDYSKFIQVISYGGDSKKPKLEDYD
jgi:hypothetical protein